jgi:3-hydroxyisobutyrate dehydrogenase
MADTIGFIGLGDMGVPMASRLADAGLAPLVWSRRRESGDPVLSRGAVWADTADAVFAACDRVVLMLAHGAAMDAVLGRGTDGFAERVRGTTLIHMGTTPPGYSQALEADVIAAGGRYAEVPVSGSTGPAATGELVAMTAGAPDALDAAADIIAHMCRAVVPCGSVPKALQMKLAVNTYLGGLVTGLFEAFNFARSADLDLPTLARVLEAGPMNCDLMRMKLPKLLTEDYTPQGSIRQAINNMQMIVDEGARVGAATPVSQVMLDLVRAADGAGWSDEDMSAMTKALAMRKSAVN